MSLFNAYKYLYYRIYGSNLRAWGENDIPQFNAMLIVSFLVYLNIYSLIIGINLITEFSIIEKLSVGKVKLAIGMIIIGVVNYFIFLDKSKYKLIAKQFKKENDIEKKRRLVWIWMYVLLSWIIFITFVVLSPKGTRFIMAGFAF